MTKQYLSEPISRVDNILFALAPLGLLTAIVLAIWISDSTKLRASIERSMASRRGVEADLMPSTPPDVRELRSGGGVVHVYARWYLLQLVHVGSESPLDDSAGLYTFQDAIHNRLYAQQSTGRSVASSDGSHRDVALRNDRIGDHHRTRP